MRRTRHMLVLHLAGCWPLLYARIGRCGPSGVHANGCPDMSWLPGKNKMGSGLSTRQPSRGAGTARGPSRAFMMRAARNARGPKAALRCGSPVGWRRAMTTDACTPSEADLRAEIAKLELELRGVTEKARLSQEALDSARSQEPTEPKKKPRRRGGKKKNKMFKKLHKIFK